MFRFARVTPTNSSFTRMPIFAERTRDTKFYNPVNTANTVASILFGVILAKRTKVGRRVKHSCNVPDIAVVNSINVISFTPSHEIFNRRTNPRFKT